MYYLCSQNVCQCILSKMVCRIQYDKHTKLSKSLELFTDNFLYCNVSEFFSVLITIENVMFLTDFDFIVHMDCNISCTLAFINFWMKTHSKILNASTPQL